jgi:hypothetical protein
MDDTAVVPPSILGVEVEKLPVPPNGVAPGWLNEVPRDTWEPLDRPAKRLPEVDEVPCGTWEPLDRPAKGLPEVDEVPCGTWEPLDRLPKRPPEVVGVPRGTWEPLDRLPKIPPEVEFSNELLLLVVLGLNN